MNNQLTTFSFHNKPIRVVEINGNPWFVATDVSQVLGLTNATVAIKSSHLGTDEVAKKHLGGQSGVANVLSESGLYKLVMRSNKAEAKAFQDWVTREVLPSIRKTGAYVTGQPSLKDNPSMDPLDLMMAQAELLPKLITQLREQRVTSEGLTLTVQFPPHL